MTMYFRPDLVHMEKFVEDGVDKELGYSIYPASKCSVPSTGLLHTARSASEKKGKMIVEDVVKQCIKIIKDCM